MGGHEDEQQADETNQIVVVEIPCLVEQEDVGDAQKEQRRAQAVAEAEHDASRQDAERAEVQVNEGSGPGPNPAEAEVREVEFRMDVVSGDPASMEKLGQLPEHDGAEG